MSLVSTISEDDDNNYSSSSSTNSDDDTDEFTCDTHRSCSRHGVCNRKNHQHSLTGSISAISLSTNSKPNKGDIRSVDGQPRHRQKHDGFKWRRICSHPDCPKYLNGGIFHNSWLCRDHLLSPLTNPVATSGRFIAKNTEKIVLTSKTPEKIVSTSKTSEKLCTRPSNKRIRHYKRGDMMIDADGIRQKYNGKTWRPVCTYDNCNSFIVANGYCHRHNLETRKKRSEILSSLDDLPRDNLISKSQPIPLITEKPKKGDIQLVRQQWNGTKWYSLCSYHTQDCTRRSVGLKCANLCDIHYKEYLEKQKDRNNPGLLSPRVKRKKSVNYDSMHSSNNIETQRTPSYRCQSTIHHEQSIQTDLTCPLESNDLRQGCILVDEDSKDRYQCDSPLVMVYVKKEEENYLNNKRKLSMDVNSLSTDCKLDITKLEF